MEAIRKRSTLSIICLGVFFFYLSCFDIRVDSTARLLLAPLFTVNSYHNISEFGILIYFPSSAKVLSFSTYINRMLQRLVHRLPEYLD